MRRLLLSLAVAVAVLVVVFEVGVGLCAKRGLLPIKVPSYSMTQVRRRDFWRDVISHFGVWHLPHAATRHVTSCYDVTYRANSYGARDSERSPASARPRVVVLGDSFVEGVGVGEAQRFTNLLERDTGIEHLNFGSAGHFGTTQYYLLYETLARGFAHAAVVVSMLPSNDFWDNDLEYGRLVHPKRYRPYLVGEYPNYRLVYHKSSLEDGAYRALEKWSRFGGRLLAEFSYTHNAFVHVKQLALARFAGGVAGARPAPDERVVEHRPSLKLPDRAYSGFHDYRRDQLDLAQYTFEQIGRLAGGKEVVIALLPTAADFRRYDPGNPTSPLSADLGRFAAANGMRLVDLLPDMYRNARDWNHYLLSCDGHWSVLGHQAAARVLRAKLEALYRDLK